SMYFLSNIVLFRLKSLISVCSAISLGSRVHITALPGPGWDSRVRPHSWRPEQPGPEPGNAGMRARPGRGAPGVPSDHDLAVIARAVVRARHDGKNDRRDAAAGQPGPGPGPGPAAEEPRGSTSPPAVTQALPAASPTPSWGTVLANTIRLWAARRRFW